LYDAAQIEHQENTEKHDIKPEPAAAEPVAVEEKGAGESPREKTAKKTGKKKKAKS
jgi:hypothetical protein